MKPQALKSGPSSRAKEVAAIMAIASPLKKKVFHEGLEFIERSNLGYKILLQPCSGRSMFSCATPKVRAAALLKAFRDKNISAILSVRGGYGSAELLPLLDFKVFGRNPKLFVGFSDLTAILINLYQRSNLACIHGPSLLTYGSKALGGSRNAAKSAASLLQLMRGEIINPFERINLEPLKRSRSRAEGRLTGGNLAILTSLLSTPWEPDFDGRIVFLEEIGEAPYRVHRMLLQLKTAGKFRGVKALVLGDFIDNRPKRSGPTYEDVVRDIFRDSNFPILGKLPVGHGDLNLPVPIGVKAAINRNRLEIIEPAVLV